MAAVRRNILTDETARKNYIQGVKLLKQEQLGPTTADLGIPGPPVPVSTYDLFVAWHHLAMDTFTPPTQSDRNAAHRGPVFLPWHRFMLVLLELQLQRVLNDADVGLPYWDWAADGELDPDEQPTSPVWADDGMGGQGNPITSGPFAFDAADPASWRVRVAANVQGQLRATNRGLRRAFGRSVQTLPTQADVAAALDLSDYDAPPWSTQSEGFRNQVEGWRPLATAPGLHNRVHVWVGGDMLPSSSPNDPVFYLKSLQRGPHLGGLAAAAPPRLSLPARPECPAGAARPPHRRCDVLVAHRPGHATADAGPQRLLHLRHARSELISARPN